MVVLPGLPVGVIESPPRRSRRREGITLVRNGEGSDGRRLAHRRLGGRVGAHHDQVGEPIPVHSHRHDGRRRVRRRDRDGLPRHAGGAGLLRALSVGRPHQHASGPRLPCPSRRGPGRLAAAIFAATSPVAPASRLRRPLSLFHFADGSGRVPIARLSTLSGSPPARLRAAAPGPSPGPRESPIAIDRTPVFEHSRRHDRGRHLRPRLVAERQFLTRPLHHDERRAAPIEDVREAAPVHLPIASAVAGRREDDLLGNGRQRATLSPRRPGPATRPPRRPPRRCPRGRPRGSRPRRRAPSRRPDTPPTTPAQSARAVAAQQIERVSASRRHDDVHVAVRVKRRRRRELRRDARRERGPRRAGTLRPSPRPSRRSLRGPGSFGYIASTLPRWIATSRPAIRHAPPPGPASRPRRSRPSPARATASGRLRVLSASSFLGGEPRGHLEAVGEVEVRIAALLGRDLRRRARRAAPASERVVRIRGATAGAGVGRCRRRRGGHRRARSRHGDAGATRRKGRLRRSEDGRAVGLSFRAPPGFPSTNSCPTVRWEPPLSEGGRGEAARRRAGPMEVSAVAGAKPQTTCLSSLLGDCLEMGPEQTPRSS